MKNLTATLFLFACFALTTFAQDTTKTVKQDKQKPKATYEVGAAKVVVWEDKKKDGATWKNFKVEKVYKKGDKWETTNSFNEKELLELKAAIDKAISEEGVKTK
ncbi:MAG: hypothetical protein HY063_10620 [Bacteroidetes bacterium]|nr:hypothetical protein [Bacteroidota bacterium]